MTKGSDGLPIRSFADAAAFGRWLANHHATSAGIWLMIAKRKGGGQGPSYAQALEEALRFGWIDSQKTKHDDAYFLQRFTRRRARSRWSKINREKAEVLIAAGRMEPSGLAEVAEAKADGRWAAAYDSPSTATVPADLQRALDANPRAKAVFEGLSAQKRYALLLQIQLAKREDTRARRIAAFVDTCAPEHRARPMHIAGAEDGRT